MKLLAVAALGFFPASASSGAVGAAAVIQADGSVGHAAKGKMVRSHGHVPHAELVEEVTWSNSSHDDTDTSAFKLALYVKQTQGLLKYNWAGWTSCAEHDQGGDKKTKLYCAPAKKVRITFVGRSRGVFDLKPNGKKSLKDLFTGNHQVMGDVAQWRSIAQCYANNCNTLGFNGKTRSRFCRFGMITNNEADCETPDHEAGVGCLTVATGSHSTCCVNTACARHNFDTKIEVEPLICEESVCPKDKKVLKKELPDFCEGSECTVDECCDDKPPEPKSNARPLSPFYISMFFLSGMALL